MKAALPALAIRSTRVRLLAATYEDALTSGTLEGRAEKPGSRMNLHDDLWTHGSYAELERLLPGSDVVFRRSYLAVAFKDQPHRDLNELVQVTRAMPRDIFVPMDVSENAGYLPGEAKAWRMPRVEQLRRKARRPVRA